MIKKIKNKKNTIKKNIIAKSINNKTILITGGTGSFGKKMLHTLTSKFKPKKIIIFSRDELKQSQLQLEYQHKKFKFIRFFIGDVRDLERLKSAFENVDVVIHAAALKQVNTAEYNPIECIKTNVNGAENVIKASIQCNVKKVIALSTDKAVNPINLYGGTKLVSEKLFISANNTYGLHPTRFAVTRYGNVIGSRGSVVPIFKNISGDKKELFPITDIRMTRFWMTLDQSVELVLNSIAQMTGGEIFIPKIPSVKITDLAKAINPNKKIKVVGLRPGEKLHESLCSIDESHLILEFSNYYLAMPTTSMNKDRKKYFKNNSGEVAKKVKLNFEYTSFNNKNFLNINDLRKKL